MKKTNRARKCKVCKTGVSGRSDKIFCSVKCKSNYAYKLREVTNLATSATDKILHRNRSILVEMMGTNKVQSKIEREILVATDFNFRYHTQTRINDQGQTVTFVYDFSWMIFSDQEILIKRVRKKT